MKIELHCHPHVCSCHALIVPPPQLLYLTFLVPTASFFFFFQVSISTLWEKTCDACLSVSGFLLLTRWFPASFILLQMTGFHSVSWSHNAPLCILYFLHTFFYWWASRLGHNAAIVNNAMETWVCRYLWHAGFMSCKYVPSVAMSHCSSTFSFLRSTALPSM